MRVREIAVDIVCADRRRLPVLINSVLVTDADGEPRIVRTTVFDATERKLYERELLAARDRERVARERTEHLHEEMRDVALTLQRSLLAGMPPDDPRFTVESLYQPAVAHLEVGGDWHDAFRLEGGKIAIVVGDVVGRGLPAASAMGQLRSAVRALAGTNLGPEAVLRHLDTFVEDVEAAQYATLIYAEVDPATGEVVRRRRPPAADPARRAARGLPRRPLDPARHHVAHAAPHPGRLHPRPRRGFVLYTDGLVERRTESLDVGIERLLKRSANVRKRTHRPRRRAARRWRQRGRRLRPHLPPGT